MTDLAKLVVSLEAESSRLQKDLDKANKKLDGFSKRADKTASLAKKAFIGLGAAIPVAALAAATKYSLDYADGIADAAEKTAFGVKELQELRYAADQSGVSVTELEGGLARFTKRLGLARRGTGAAAKAYKDLGLDLSQTNNQVFQQVVETLGNMESETDRLAMATRFFGDDAQRLGVLFKDGNRGLQEYANKAHELGLVLSDDLVRGASDANDQLATMKQVLNAQFTRVFVELAPIITELGQAFADAAPKVAAFFGSFGDVGEQSQDSLALTIRNLESQIKELESLRERITTDSPNTVESILGFPKNEAEIDEQIDALVDKLSRARFRLNKLTEAPVSDKGGAGIPDPLSFNDSDTDKLVEKYNAAYESMQKTVALIGVTTEYEKTLWAVEKGRFKDLSEGQKQALLDASKRIDQKQAAIEATKDAAKAEEEAAKSAEKLNAQLDAQADRWRELVNPAQGAYNQMAELDLLLETGRISWETYGDAMFKVMDDFESKIEESTEKATTFMEEAARNMQDAMADGFFDLMQGELGNLEESFKRTLDRMVANALASELNGWLFGDIGKTGDLGGAVGKAVDWGSDLLGFDGGGYTGDGARVGGLDGKGGYLAMVHPRETIVDHTKGQSIGGMSVTINVNGVKDEGSLRRTSAQIAQRSGVAAQRAIARNG